MNKCNYRRCEKDLSKVRKGALYCCAACKNMEKVYRKREKAKIQKWKELEYIKIEEIKRLKELVKDDLGRTIFNI